MSAAEEPLPRAASGGPGGDGRRVVLVGLDGSTTSLRAAMWACGLARREHCRLVMAHVVSTDSWLWAALGAGAAVQRLLDDLQADLRAEVRQMTEGCPGPVSFVSRLGHPSDGLAGIADEVRADVVVVGASNQVHRWLGGSVPAGLIRAGRWPVIVIP